MVKNKKTKTAKLGKKLKKSSKNKIKVKSFVTKEMSFGEIMEKYPVAVEILMNSGMHCIGCSVAEFETLEQGALMHGINPDKIVKSINDKIKKSMKSKKGGKND